MRFNLSGDDEKKMYLKVKKKTRACFLYDVRYAHQILLRTVIVGDRATLEAFEKKKHGKNRVFVSPYQGCYVIYELLELV